jgi:1,4-dihydroxy-2-naphthoate polyprenyltransferase
MLAMRQRRMRTMRVNVLVILGHPRRPSLCAALADAYADGARAAGLDVMCLDLGALEFDPDVHEVSPADQPLEPDLERARALIAWAQHLVFVYPGWWGVGPARLKGFLDRVLLPGFAFREANGSFEGLLGGRTAHLITTLDMPPWVYCMIFRSGGHHVMKRSALGFCGVETTRIVTLGPVKDADDECRARWLARVRALGSSLRSGPRSTTQRARRYLGSWLRALRLQFYPMTWAAYTAGALAAAQAAGRWDTVTWVIGYVFLFCLEAATVFANERFDYDSDRRNGYGGPFNGGSRVLVDGSLSVRAIERGVGAMLALAVIAGAWLLLRVDPGAALPIAMGLLTVAALGYTVPPLQFSWRGLGELDVGLTHGPGVVLIGYLALGGDWRDPLPWLVSVPLLLSILPAITLSGVPDRDADGAAGKRTLAVRFGRRGAVRIALATAIAAVAAVWLSAAADASAGVLDTLRWLALAHGGWLVWVLWRELDATRARIDGVMVAALSFSAWFAVLPMLALW